MSWERLGKEDNKFELERALSHAWGTYGVVCIYRMSTRSVSVADIRTMVRIAAEGAGMCAMTFQGDNCTGIPDVEVQADMGAVIGFKVVPLP